MTTPSPEQVVHRYLDAVGSLDLTALAETFAPNVVMDLPFAPADIPRHLEGKPAVTAFFDAMPQMITPLHFHDYRIEVIAGEPGSLIAHYTSDARILATGLPYRNTYISRFHVDDGLITWFAEYFDPLVFVEALGGVVTPPEPAGQQ
jgi:ketosteroid isomerase-like protein